MDNSLANNQQITNSGATPVPENSVKKVALSPWDEEPDLPLSMQTPKVAAQVAQVEPFLVPANPDLTPPAEQPVPAPIQPVQPSVEPQNQTALPVNNVVMRPPISAAMSHPTFVNSIKQAPQPAPPMVDALRSSKPAVSLASAVSEVEVPVSSLASFKPEQKAEPIAPSNANQSLIKKLLKPILLGIVGLFLILITLGYLTERGMVSLGLEKIYGAVKLETLWGGLPANAENALGIAFFKIKEGSGYGVSGNLSITINKDIKSEVTTPLISYLSNFLAIKPEKANFALKGDIEVANGAVAADQSNLPIYQITSPKIKELQADFNGSVSKKGNKIDLDLKRVIGSDKISLKSNEGKLWVLSDKVKFNDMAEAGKWLEYDFKPIKNKVLFDEIFSISSNGLTIDGRRTGSEKIDGVRSFRYKIDSLNLGDSLKGIGIDSSLIQEVSGEVWIGIKNKEIKRIILEAPIVPSKSVTLVKFTINFNGPAETFTPPESKSIINPAAVAAAKKIVEEAAARTVSDAANTAKQTESVAIIARDATRKADLASIKDALTAYKAKVGKYPVATTAVKLNNTSNAVAKKLIPTYIVTFPKDPKDPTYTYTYKSNSTGTTFTLSCKLENTADPEGTLVSGSYLYNLTDK